MNKVLCLQVVEPVFQRIDETSRALQDPAIDYDDALAKTFSDIDHFSSLLIMPFRRRAQDIAWTKTEEYLGDYDVEVSLPRVAGKKSRNNAAVEPEEPPQVFFERKYFAPFIAEIVDLYRQRFNDRTKLLPPLGLLIPFRLRDKNPKVDTLQKTFQFYSADMPGTFDDFRREFERWDDYWRAEQVTSSDQIEPLHTCIHVWFFKPTISNCRRKEAFPPMSKQH